MILQKIVRALERIERNQAAILDRLAALEGKHGQAEKLSDEWIQKGIDNILAYQAGKKRGDGE